jgi:hypothetical protein
MISYIDLYHHQLQAIPFPNFTNYQAELLKLLNLPYPKTFPRLPVVNGLGIVPVPTNNLENKIKNGVKILFHDVTNHPKELTLSFTQELSKKCPQT